MDFPVTILRPNCPAIFSAAAAAFLPSDLPNLAAWYRKSIGQTTGQWDDQSGNTRHMALTATPGLSGGIYTFNGTTQFGAAAFTLPQPNTFAIRFTVPTYQTNAVIHDGNTPSSSQLFMNSPSPAIAMFAGTGQVVDATHMPVGSVANIASVYNGASSDINVTSTANQVTGNPGATAAGGVKIAVSGNGSTGFCNLLVEEVIIYSDAKGNTDLDSILAYLATR